MAKLNYQYQGGNSRRPSRESSGKFRLPVIFVIIALLTGGIIYFLLPRETGTPVPGENGDTAITQPAENHSGESPSLPSETPIGENTGSPITQPAENHNENTVPDPAAPPAAETPEAEKNPAAGSGESLMQPSDFPEKGKPWKNDPPEESPVIPENGENSLQWRETAQELTRQHIQMIRHQKDIPGFTIRHKVKNGESFSRIASQNDTTYDMIKQLSGFPQNHNPNRLNVGQNLRLLPGPWHIVVEKKAKLLKLFAARNGKEELFAVWEIGIGRQNTTPEGEFVIYDRLVNPSWTAPDGSVVSFGSPENPLGNRFLKLAKKESPKQPAGGLGIHGTNDDNSVTRSLSSGCIRMRNTDIEVLFSIVPARSRVTVKE